MKQIVIAIFVVLFSFTGYSKVVPGSKIKDGLYLIVSIDTTDAQRAVPANGMAVKFSKLFEEFNGERGTRIVIDTNEYVPLDLRKSPTTEPETEAKKKLMLSLTSDASEKLKTFTAKYVMRRVAIVVDGEVLTMHKIKEAITSGQLQIKRCTDNACERLYFKLEDNVKR